MPPENVSVIDNLDDDDFPRSGGGHCRYSRRQLRIAARARELVDQGTPIEAACRIVSLEDQLDDALCLNREIHRKPGEHGADTWSRRYRNTPSAGR
ncbi:MerR family transcriptional regulator [Streptomyces collinus]|uniref:MerR family transcriptional regulator n=1 Tax=Streptomyces collinus TaxID=42684 RepID=UPI0036ECA563